MAHGTSSLRTGRTLGAFLLSAAALVGCAGASNDGAVGAQTDDTESEALSATSDAYVTVTRDPRDCMGPRCGGYWVRKVNTCAREVYASQLDLAPLAWSAEQNAVVLATPPDELVLRGHLGAADAKYGTRALVVTAAYRGGSGLRAGAKDVVVAVSPRTPRVECITAPCPQWTAQPMNKGASAATFFDRVDVSAAVGPRHDAASLTDSVEHEGALVAGTFVAGAAFPGGRERVLDASQVFVHLPEL